MAWELAVGEEDAGEAEEEDEDETVEPVKPRSAALRK